MQFSISSGYFPRLRSGLSPHVLGMAVFLVLAACSTLNPITLARMARMDPLTVPPGDVAVRLSLPAGLTVRTGDAVLEISVTNKRSGARLGERFELVENDKVWTLTPEASARLASLQTEARGWPDDERDGTLEMWITGCKQGAGPAPGALIEVDISFDTGRTFAPLVRNLAAEEVIGLAEAGGAGRLRECPAE